MLAPARSKRPRSPSPPSSPSIHSPLELLIKRRRNERPPLERELSREGEDEWAGVERRRNRMWGRAQEPGPSRLPATETEDQSEQSQQANHWETPIPTRAYHSQHHHHHHPHQPSSSPIRPPDNVPTYSPFGDNQPPNQTAGNVSYREPRGYFDIRTPGSPVASPTPFPAAWDSPYAGSNALLHQLVSDRTTETATRNPLTNTAPCSLGWSSSDAPLALSTHSISPTTDNAHQDRRRYGYGPR